MSFEMCKPCSSLFSFKENLFFFFSKSFQNVVCVLFMYPFVVKMI